MKILGCNSSASEIKWLTKLKNVFDFQLYL